MLSAENISYQLGKHYLLKDISLTLEPGEILAVIGPNGAGKSTFLKLLSDELTPTSGSISLEGKELQQWTKLECARRRAVMPQVTHVAFPFRAFEVVLLGRSPYLHSRESQHDEEIAIASMKLTNVDVLANRFYDTLSGGEKQRVQLARVLSQIWESSERERERYLLLDEPVSNMDMAHQHETLCIAREFSQRGVGVLVILHDINLAAMYADRIAIFREGRLCHCERPKSILTRPIIREVFGVDVMLQTHPQFDCPVVISAPIQPAVH